ncbi:MAG: succinate--CoA ligase subunit beta, partial [Methylococcales bacterium]
MNIHEYQAKQLFQNYAIPIPEGRVATTTIEAENIAQELTHES